jgi:hypothetical protein
MSRGGRFQSLPARFDVMISEARNNSELIEMYGVQKRT